MAVSAEDSIEKMKYSIRDAFIREQQILCSTPFRDTSESETWCFTIEGHVDTSKLFYHGAELLDTLKVGQCGLVDDARVWFVQSDYLATSDDRRRTAFVRCMREEAHAETPSASVDAFVAHCVTLQRRAMVCLYEPYWSVSDSRGVERQFRGARSVVQ
jgi:hypothetical protein